MEEDFGVENIIYIAMQVEEKDEHIAFWAERTPFERLEAAWHIINHQYGITSKTKLDRTVFSSGKQ